MGLMMVVVLGIFLSGCEEPPQITVDDTGATTEGINEVVEANNQFALELYSKYKSEEGNVFFSPYSISTALAMIYEGAQGETAEEMQGVFHFPQDDNVRRPNFAKIYNEMNKQDKEYKLSTANALWAQKDYLFLEEYMNNINDYYGGKVTNLDFVTQTEQSRKMINDWIEDQTNNKIKDLIPHGYLNSMTRLVLTNAIYFKGDWVYQFDKRDTREQDFKITEDNIVQVPMMHLDNDKAKFNYAETEDLQILEMPYEGEELSMMILLPKNSLEDIELTPEKLAEWENMMTEQEVVISMPKFTFETKYFMSETLKEMGMPTAFSEEADFSGMTGKKDLFLSFVIHQAFIDVNEEGTEAAAATAGGMVMTSVKQTNVFQADHPFIFIIQERETSNILFLGRVVDPR
jgi:serpin B